MTDLVPTRYFEYDPSTGRLISVTLPEVVNPDTSSTEHPVYAYGYDEFGNQVSIVDPLNHETRFEYDDLGRETSRTLPEGQIDQQFYNDLG